MICSMYKLNSYLLSVMISSMYKSKETKINMISVWSVWSVIYGVFVASSQLSGKSRSHGLCTSTIPLGDPRLGSLLTRLFTISLLLASFNTYLRRRGCKHWKITYMTVIESKSCPCITWWRQEKEWRFLQIGTYRAPLRGGGSCAPKAATL